MFSIMNVEIQILFTTFRCYKFHILFKKDTKIIYTYLRASFLGLTDNIDMKDFKHTERALITFNYKILFLNLH